MMTFATVLCVACLGLVVYSYLFYPLVIALFAAASQLRADAAFVAGKRERRQSPALALPTVGVVISAFNEERHIRARIDNLFALDYPAQQIRFYIGSDGSGDATAELLRGVDDPRLVAMVFENNRGKASVLNDLVAASREEILVFSDANSMFEAGAIRALVAPFGRPEVGGVCGELRLAGAGGDNQDSLYWRFEQFLKFCEARVGALLGANGAIYAIRRTLWKPLAADTVCDDFIVAMDVAAAGHRLVYAPSAIANEQSSEEIGDEYRRRVRIGIGNFQALFRRPEYLTRTTGATAFAYLSHKVLRWIAPHLTIVGWGAAALLASQSQQWFMFAALLAAGIIAAALAFRLSERGVALPSLARIPAFLFALNWAFLISSWRYATNRYQAGWQRSARS